MDASRREYLTLAFLSNIGLEISSSLGLLNFDMSLPTLDSGLCKSLCVLLILLLRGLVSTVFDLASFSLSSELCLALLRLD